ncbi:hypothetical protein F4859DRAFT_529943 [Xylaria cf. heliscus]|nr:hypothetical protein F4859DRAFT_529943 [Xylaria cf. heliscus]
MPDPLSITSGALAVITATQKTASVIYKFIQDCKESRADLAQIRGELSQLTLILELIRDENAATAEDCLPDTLQAQVQAMLTSCMTTVQQIENILARCRGKPGPLRWTMLEKEKVTTLKASLEALKSGLKFALETANLSMTRAASFSGGDIEEQESGGEISHKDAEEQEMSNHEAAGQPSALRVSMPVVINAGPNEIPHHIIASMPCRSKWMTSRYCPELDIWATLHEDLILRLWSPYKTELIASIPVLRKSTGDLVVDTVKPGKVGMRIRFCPAKPELILIQVERHEVEMWNWKENRRICIATDLKKMTLSKNSIVWVRFVPQSMLVYAVDSRGPLMVVDLDEPLISSRVSLEILINRAQREPGQSRDEIHFRKIAFVSSCEIWILWEKTSMRRHSSWGTRSRSVVRSAAIVRLLPTISDLNRQKVSVTTRYNDIAINSAQVTARYELQPHLQVMSYTQLDSTTRRLAFSGRRPAVGDKERSPLVIYVLDLDTGSRLFELPLLSKNREWEHHWQLPAPYRYLLYHKPGTDLTRVVHVEDGRDLGMLKWRVNTIVLGKTALMRQVDGRLQFGITDVTWDELGK